MATKTKPAVDHSALSGAAADPPIENAGAAKTVSFFSGEKPKPAATVSSILALVEGGRVVSPPRILIYGTEGIGKSTLASKADEAIFIQTEDGLETIDCKRFPLSRSYADVIQKLKALVTEAHSYQTVVVDSLDWLERLIWENVCQRDPKGANHIEKVGGGFAKGYQYALEEWNEFIGLLDKCRAKGMAVILLAHAKIERFEDPENPAYDRYSPRLNKHAQAVMVEWVDAVLFATKRMTVKTEGSGFNERGIAAPIGAGGGERILKCVGSPACVAKNRYAMPDIMPLSWEAIVAALSKFMNG